MVISDGAHESEDDEYSKLLKEEPQHPLNREGSPGGEPATFPRGCQICSHIPQMFVLPHGAAQ